METFVFFCNYIVLDALKFSHFHFASPKCTELSLFLGRSEERQQNVIVFSRDKNIHCRGRVLRVGHDGLTARVHLVDYGSIEEFSAGAMATMPPAAIHSLDQVVFRVRMREVDYGFEPYQPEVFKAEFESILGNEHLRVRILDGSQRLDMLEIMLEYGKHHYDGNKKLGNMGYQRPLVWVFPSQPA